MGWMRNKTSLRLKIMLTVILLALLPMAIGGATFYWRMLSVLTSNANDNLSQLLVHTNDNIESTFDALDDNSLYFLSIPTVRSWFTGNVSSHDDQYDMLVNKYKMEDELKYSMLFNTAWKNRLINTAYIFLNESSYVSVTRLPQVVSKTDDNNIRIYRQIKDKVISGAVIIPPTPQDPTVYFVRSVSNLYQRERRLTLIIGINETEIFNKYFTLLSYPGATALITDEQGIIYSSSDKQRLGSKADKTILDLKKNQSVTETEWNGQTFLVASTPIGESGLVFTVGIPKKQVLATFNGPIRSFLLMLLWIIAIFLALSILLSLGFTRFIKDLLRTINQIKIGNYDVRMPEYKEFELSILSNTINKMTVEIRHLIKQVYEKQLLVKETEFKFLQSQMNPHFLFNTLTTIGYKARMSKDETVFKMVTALTELLQASIYSDSKDKITIEQELVFIRFYLYLQKIRFEDKLDFRIDIPDETVMRYYLPKLCVEPIVENAVLHGLEKKLGKGTVTVRIWNENDSVYFDVEDDGVGYDPDLTASFADRALMEPKKARKSIGLRNTQERIRLMYGEPYGISVESARDKGTKVRVHIPIDRGEDIGHVSRDDCG